MYVTSQTIHSSAVVIILVNISTVVAHHEVRGLVGGFAIYIM